MKESPKKQKGKRNLLPWLLLGILAVCVAILLFLYGRQSGYTILKTEQSQTEESTTSEEESTSSRGTGSASSASSASSRNSSSSTRSTSSRTSSQNEEEESSQAAESLPESLGETPTPILSQSETSSSASETSSSASYNQEQQSTQTNSQEISGLTIQWESQDRSAFAQLWAEYAQTEPLFSALAEQGTPVRIYLYAAEGTDAVVWEEACYWIVCYAGSDTMEQIYWDTALLLEEVLRQQGRWEDCAVTYQTFNPRNFTYGDSQELYVGRYFCSLESQQSLTQDRLEVWQLVLQGQEPVYGPLLEKYYCLRSEYNGIFE